MTNWLILLIKQFIDIIKYLLVADALFDLEYDKNKKLKEIELNTRIFEGPSKEWALFVINNRNRDYQDINSIECNHDNKYDLVIGPVADDDLALLFRQFSGGLISVEVLVEAMKFKKLTNQYSFHTERALELLEKVRWSHG